MNRVPAPTTRPAPRPLGPPRDAGTERGALSLAFSPDGLTWTTDIDPSGHVALRRDDDETVLGAETGIGTDVMTRHVWDLTGLLHTEVFIEIADLSLLGHVNVDGIR